MGKKVEKTEVVLDAVFVDDTKTFHYFSIADESGVIGNVYWPKEGKPLPGKDGKLVLNLLATNHEDRDKGLDLLIARTNGKGKTYERLVGAKNS